MLGLAVVPVPASVLVRPRRVPGARIPVAGCQQQDGSTVHGTGRKGGDWGESERGEVAGFGAVNVDAAGDT
jgi:hypothetical protein